MTCTCPDCTDQVEVQTERVDKRLFVATMEDMPFMCAYGSTRKRAGDALMDYYESAILHLN